MAVALTFDENIKMIYLCFHLSNCICKVCLRKTSTHQDDTKYISAFKYIHVCPPKHGTLAANVGACYRFVIHPDKRQHLSSQQPAYISTPITEITEKIQEEIQKKKSVRNPCCPQLNSDNRYKRKISIKSLFPIFTKIHSSRDITLCLKFGPLMKKLST